MITIPQSQTDRPTDRHLVIYTALSLHSALHRAVKKSVRRGFIWYDLYETCGFSATYERLNHSCPLLLCYFPRTSPVNLNQRYSFCNNFLSAAIQHPDHCISCILSDVKECSADLRPKRHQQHIYFLGVSRPL